jgi:hypothetical protein
LKRESISPKVFFVLIQVGLLLILNSCSTKHNTWITRSFHNTTSRFNGYFYANESVKDGLIKLETTRKEDYSKILPVFIYPTPDQTKALYPEMDKAVKKLSIVIWHHTITTKAKKEIPGACRWIAPSYILMGRAHFYKRDFFAATECFDYVAQTYKKANDGYLGLRWLIKNTDNVRYPLLSNRFMGMMWLVRSYDEMGSISEAESMIDLLADDKELPSEYKGELAAIEANHFLLRDNYGGALKPLGKAILLTEDRKTRARYTYIVAQLEEKAGKMKKASESFRSVIKLRPGYELAFNAQMSLANCIDISSEAEAEALKKELIKMLKNKINSEHRDQIYYALAIIEEKESHQEECVNYLKKSIRVCVNNSGQKALSFLKLADISFDKADYRPAQYYYDSTVSLIKPDFPNYELINNKKKSLSDLIKNMTIISVQDSLQALARMNPQDRDVKIQEVIAQEEAAEKMKEEDRLNRAAHAGDNNQVPQTNLQQNNGQWYFYNTNTVTFGITDFHKKWGDRKLEDNWRRSVKELTAEDASVAANADQAEAADSIKKTTTTKKISGKKSSAGYLQNIPLTEDALKKSNEKIIEAYYTLGSIYKEQLYNNGKSAETFEELLQRYPENKYKLTSYYQLYRLYLAMGNQDKTDYYKNILLTKFPETEYAKIIRNPGYNSQKVSDLSAAERMYNETFQLYKDSNYAAVISKCFEADTALGNNPLLSRFDLLNALALAHTQGVDAFESALTLMIIKYPKGDIKDKAQEYLDLIKKQKNKNIPEAKKDSIISDAVQYLFDKNAQFLFVFIYDGNTDVNKLKIQFADINAEYYSLDNLKVDYIIMDNGRNMITVKSFDGKEKAMIYYNLITKDKKDVFSALDPAKIKPFVISSDNFPLFYKSKNVENYLAFFQDKFLK